MKPLSHFLNEETIREIKDALHRGQFPKLTFEQAMQFILSDGILPASRLPVQSFLALEDWLRNANQVSVTATELKNRTGEVIETVLKGKTVKLLKHGRVIAEIRPV